MTKKGQQTVLLALFRFFSLFTTAFTHKILLARKISLNMLKWLLAASELFAHLPCQRISASQIIGIFLLT